MKTTIDFKKLIEYGIKAPSGHNTQPWYFTIEENAIEIHPDFSRALPVVDSDNHALYISLGCAVENIAIAAAKYGLQSGITIKEDKDNKSFIVISFISVDSIQEDELLNYVDKRQSTRNEYSDKKVPKADLNELKNSFEFEGVELITLTGESEINDLEPLILEGSNKQFQNKEFVKELVNWFRFSKAEAEKKGDGLWIKSMGLPNMNRFIGNIVMKYFVSAKSEARRWKKLIDATAGFALFTAAQNDITHWVRLGRAFQRFGLTATKLGISHAHVNMPCEELEVREKLVKKFNLGSSHPLLLIRFGYSETMPYSLRRGVDEVLINKKVEAHG
ncbi:Acg family FMN-binding oxidoreductase [Halalkalibaculum sp. DA384]|uniref:Acg family FMN-binding oxidoreductase n=1 Tax=Halalkalibaculum sp. DA384 TaxID=3373606 RepID=UPI00375474F6